MRFFQLPQKEGMGALKLNYDEFTSLISRRNQFTQTKKKVVSADWNQNDA